MGREKGILRGLECAGGFSIQSVLSSIETCLTVFPLEKTVDSAKVHHYVTKTANTVRALMLTEGEVTVFVFWLILALVGRRKLEGFISTLFTMEREYDSVEATAKALSRISKETK